MSQIKSRAAILILLILFCFCQNPKGESEVTEATEPFANSFEMEASSAPKAITRMILEDRKGNIWLSTFDGVFMYEGKEFFKVPSSISKARFFSVLEDRKGNIWFGTIGEGVFKFDGNGFENITNRDGLASNEITSIYEDGNGHIWFGGNGGFSIFDGQSFKNFILEKDQIVEDPNLKPKIIPNPTDFNNRSINEVNSIIEDRNGLFWIATRGSTYTYDRVEFKKVEHEDGPFSNVRWIMEDQSGDVWLVGQSGVWRYSKDSFTRIVENFTGYIFQSREGHIYISTNLGNDEGWGLLKIDQSRLNDSVPEVDIISSGLGMAFGIEEAEDGLIWFGTLQGIRQYNPSQKTQ
ncbi:ligand-binding sensor domain-containing protein [Algoriphagus sediminis]|uniref:Two-component regulator propeller domain-containing protein n=1 Tax=Algoriphagus sediminis TaxID=3057113 RepID=A0ABT7YDE7_9BACT|nr:two-component regulator propeller domain-containing protein [Algoriphagus sediminis]MDN3204542.1 two-component regulator propeller domain-containing protein [Algoriphagus sediminis]